MHMAPKCSHMTSRLSSLEDDGVCSNTSGRQCHHSSSSSSRDGGQKVGRHFQYTGRPVRVFCGILWRQVLTCDLLRDRSSLVAKSSAIRLWHACFLCRWLSFNFPNGDVAFSLRTRLIMLGFEFGTNFQYSKFETSRSLHAGYIDR